MGDGTFSSFDTTGTFIDSSKISVHITRVSTPSGNFFSSGGDLTIFSRLLPNLKTVWNERYYYSLVLDFHYYYLTKSISIRTHISQYNKDVFPTFISQILCCCECNSRSDDSLNGRIICLFGIYLEGQFHFSTNSKI